MSDDQNEKSQQIFAEVDRSFNEEIDFLRNLIRIQTENPPGEYERITSFIDTFARKNALQTEILETPQEICREAGVEGPKRLSIKTVLGAHGMKPRILLLAHLDTVPIGDEDSWTHGPFSGDLADGRIYGRGSCDCKGRVAAYLFAQLALARVSGDFPAQLTVACTADEEIGGHTGAEYLLETGKLDCDFCVGEGYTWQVYNGFKGLLWARIVIKGKSAHGSTPELGVSVVPALQTILEQVNRYRTTLAPETTLNVGVVKAGAKINMVPDLATAEIDMRLGEEEDVQNALDSLNRLVEKAQNLQSSTSIRLEILNRVNPIAISSDHFLVRTIRSSAEEVSRSQIPVKLWFAHSDTVHFLMKGIPSVNYGVGRAGVAHTTDEHIYVEDLKLATKVIALSASRLVGM